MTVMATSMITISFSNGFAQQFNKAFSACLEGKGYVIK